jgi:hypothetical protein
VIHIDKASARRGWSWLARGPALLGKDAALWVGMATIYGLLAALLSFVPFVGDVLLVLFTPILLAGALEAAHALFPLTRMSAAEYAARAVDPRPPGSAGPGQWPQYSVEQLGRGLRQLVSVFTEQHRATAVMVIGTLSLGAVVMIDILGKLLRVGGPAIRAWLSGDVNYQIGLPAALGLLIVVVLYVLVYFAVLYAVPLVLFRGEQVLNAMTASLRACLGNFAAVAVLSAPPLIALAAGTLLYARLAAPWDVLAVWAVTALAAPWFVAALYQSYQDSFVGLQPQAA